MQGDRRDVKRLAVIRFDIESWDGDLAGACRRNEELYSCAAGLVPVPLRVRPRTEGRLTALTLAPMMIRLIVVGTPTIALSAAGSSCTLTEPAAKAAGAAASSIAAKKRVNARGFILQIIA